MQANVHPPVTDTRAVLTVRLMFDSAEEANAAAERIGTLRLEALASESFIEECG